jgi:hypothetical protein
MEQIELQKYCGDAPTQSVQHKKKSLFQGSALFWFIDLSRLPMTGSNVDE